MATFARLIRPLVDTEIDAAAVAEDRGHPALAFSHLERAHVLGQASTTEHVRVHWQMLRWGWRQRSARDCVGQLFRILGAASKTAFGWVPSGNTGGSNVSPFKRLPIPADLALLLQKVRMHAERPK